MQKTGHSFAGMASRVIVACASMAALTAGAAPAFTYVSGGVEKTKSSWTSDTSDSAAGWAYDSKLLDTDTLTLSGPGPYKLSGRATDFSVIVAGSCTVTFEGYSASNSKTPVVVSGGATLTLLVGEGTSTLAGATTITEIADTGHAGIEVQSGGTVVIDKVEGATDADCVLNVNGGNDSAAIGASDSSSCGDIVINGGTINATGGNEAAGIGGCNVKRGTVTMGSITINGGVVTATGNDRGAGIGTGLVQAGGTVTAAGIYINGGTVTATETDGRAAAIGAGEVTGTALSGGGSAMINEIVITGGTVTASACRDKDGSTSAPQEAAGAGIGTGMVEMGGQAAVTKIEISGGEVTATGACRGAGIGAGEVYDGYGYASAASSTTVSDIVISGGQVTATGGAEAAGIGTGVAHGQNVQSEIADITISGGTVEAKKGDNATGSDIGLATSANTTGTTTMNSVTVTGGSIAAGTAITNPSSGAGGDVYALAVSGDWQPGEAVTVVGMDGYGVNDIYADENGGIVMLVANGDYAFGANGCLFEATVEDGAATARRAAAAAWLDGSPLGVNAIAPDGGNMALTFAVPLRAGLDFENWVGLSVGNSKLAVVVAESLPALAGSELATLLNGGTVEGASLIYVGTAACSPSAAEYVSSDSAAMTMAIRVPKALPAAGFYRVCVLND